jgi:hypothetical protein
MKKKKDLQGQQPGRHCCLSSLHHTFQFRADHQGSSPETRSPLAAAEIVLDHELLQAPEQPSQFMNVALDEVDASLTAEQREKVSSTVAMTKKVLASLQWKEIDKSIADAMSRKEKENAKMQYLRELDKTINWHNIEQNMKAKYDNIDWNLVNSNVKTALTNIQLDSLQQCYTEIINQLDKSKSELCSKSKVSLNPMPDGSVEELKRSTEELRMKVDSIRSIRERKVIRL